MLFNVSMKNHDGNFCIPSTHNSKSNFREICQIPYFFSLKSSEGSRCLPLMLTTKVQTSLCVLIMFYFSSLTPLILILSFFLRSSPSLNYLCSALYLIVYSSLHHSKSSFGQLEFILRLAFPWASISLNFSQKHHSKLYIYFSYIPPVKTRNYTFPFRH